MNWQGVVIHHSASGDVPATEIDQWHRDRGWDQIGYHFVIRQNGDIEPARNWAKAGAHAKTGKPYSRNTTHLGICLTGNFEEHPPTLEQLTALIKLTRGLISRWDAEKIEKHHERCPGPLFPWEFFIAALRKEVSK